MKQAKLPALLLAVLSAPTLAHAENDTYTRVLERGVWAGCVQEEGYAPYPVTLIPHPGFLAVSYPSLSCAGIHDRDGVSGSEDAVERIRVDPGQRCATDLPVTYTLQGESLRIDYDHAGMGTHALLRPSSPGATPPSCSSGEAVS